MTFKIKLPSLTLQHSQFFKSTILKPKTSPSSLMQRRTTSDLKSVVANLTLTYQKESEHLAKSIRNELTNFPSVMSKHQIKTPTPSEIIGTRFFTDIPDESKELLEQLDELSLQSEYINRVTRSFAVMAAQEKCSVYMLSTEEEHKLFEIAPKSIGYCFFVEKNSDHNFVCVRSGKNVGALLHEMTHAVFYNHSLASLHAATYGSLGHSLKEVLADHPNFQSLFDAYNADVELFNGSEQIEESEQYQRHHEIVTRLQKSLNAHRKIDWLNEIPPYYSVLATLWSDETLSEYVPHLYQWMHNVMGPICDDYIRKNQECLTASPKIK